MSPSQSSDPIVRFVEETIGDVFGPRQRGRVGSDGASHREARLVPLSIPAGAVALVGVFSAQLIELVREGPAGAAVQRWLTTAGDWRVLLVFIAVLAGGFDVLRFFASRHRTALRNRILKTTQCAPTSVRVTLLPGKLPPSLWWPSTRAPRRAVARFESGTVMDSARLTTLRTAVKASAGPGWDMQVSWDAPRERIVITRTPVSASLATAGSRSPRHRRLETSLARSPLRDSMIEAIVDKSIGQPDAREVGYRVDFSPSLAIGDRNVQSKLEGALREILGRHPSGRLWRFTWQLGHDAGDRTRDGESARLLIELQEALPTRIEHVPPAGLAELTGHQRYQIPYGVGVGGKIAVWDISWKSNVPHALVVGPTGGGKTTVLRAFVVELVLRAVTVLAVDPKKIELDGLENWPGVTAVVYTLRQACELISAVHAEMHARLDWVHATKIPNTELPIFAFILDELFVFSGMVQRAQKSGDKVLSDWVKGEDPLGKLADIAALIRSAGGRRADGVQRPDAYIYGEAGGNARDNYGTRICLAKLSPDGAYMMWGDSTIGREVDTSIPGRSMASNERGDPFGVQIVWTPDVDDHPNKWNRLSEEDRAIVTALRPTSEPVFVAYSREMRSFLTRLGRPYETPDVVDGVVSKPAQMPARDLSLGDRLHHVDDDGVTKVTGIVSKVRVTESHVYVDLVSDARPRWQAEYRLDEYVDADPLGSDDNPAPLDDE
uniref:FtsK/SpoIIIE domain-containing protein n=1 Tax=Nocardia suismassiliense TaxID=2077092 RepID=UPI003F492C89